MLRERAAALRELGEALRLAGGAVALVGQAGGDAASFAGVLASSCPCFDDQRRPPAAPAPSSSGANAGAGAGVGACTGAGADANAGTGAGAATATGPVLRFLKRAQLCASALAGSTLPGCELGGLDRLTVFSDYRLPQVL